MKLCANCKYYIITGVKDSGLISSYDAQKNWYYKMGVCKHQADEQPEWASCYEFKPRFVCKKQSKEDGGE
jgi:hypothetical protein